MNFFERTSFARTQTISIYSCIEYAIVRAARRLVSLCSLIADSDAVPFDSVLDVVKTFNQSRIFERHAFDNDQWRWTRKFSQKAF
jgi:hypothetical protein